MAAIVLILFSLLTKSLAWRVLLEKKATVGQTYLIVNEGYFLNNIFPLRAGEIGRAIFMGRTSGLGSLHILSTIVIERAFDVAIAAGLLIATLPLALEMDWAQPVANTTLVMVILGIFLLYLSARFNQQVENIIHSIGKRWPLVDRVVAPHLESILNGLKVLTKPTLFFICIFWVFITWLLWFLTYYVMLLSIAPTAPFWWAVFLLGVLAMSLAIPSAPAGLGVFEASTVGALSLLGVSNSKALAYAIAIHALQFAINGILGFYGLVKQGRSLAELFSEIQLKQ